MTWMIEGEWLGYRSSQDRICHREYTTKKYAERVKAIGYAIRFSDGTQLRLSVTDSQVSRRKLPEIRSYCELIRDCAYEEVSSVDALYKKRDAQKAERANQARELSLASAAL